MNLGEHCVNNDKKAVMIIDGELPAGLIANTAAILGATLGKRAPEYIGHDVTDASGLTHTGIITIPVPILKGDKEKLRALRQNLFADEYGDLAVIDFSDVAQGCKTYGDYTELVSRTEEHAHTYLGVAIFGDKKKVNRLTGDMPLLR